MVTVRKIMRNCVATLPKDAKVSDAARYLAKDNSGCIVIIDNEKPVGIITARDIIRNDVLKMADFKESVVGIMSFPVTAMEPDMKLELALKIVDTKQFRRYPVVEDGKLVGLVSKKDVITSASENQRFHLRVQTTVLAIFVVFELFVFFHYYLPSLIK